MQLKSTFTTLVFVCLTPTFSMTQVFTITDLGPISPTGINSWAQIVGNNNNQAYIWSFGQIRALGKLTGGRFSLAAAINDRGVVTGIADGPTTLISRFTGLPNVGCADLTQPFIWTSRVGMRALGAPANLPSAFFGVGQNVCTVAIYGRGINNSSQVVGDIPDGPNAFALTLLWTRTNGMTAFGGTWPPTFGNGINNSGEIVGQNSAKQCEGRATAWKNGDATDLGDLGAGAADFVSSATGVNDVGTVVGWSTINPASFLVSSPVHATLSTSGVGMRDLGTLPGDTSSAASKINLIGEVIGSSGDTDYVCSGFAEAPFEVVGRPFIWSEKNGMQDLNVLISPNSGWVLYSANDINVWGQIVGQGVLNGQPHGYLLTPNNPFDPY